MMTTKKYKINLANLSVKKILFEFAEEMNFAEKALGKKSTRNVTLFKLPKTPAVPTSWVSAIFLPINRNES